MDNPRRLTPVFERLQRLAARVDDTLAAPGSDVMDGALDGCNPIKLSAGAHGLDELRRELSGRFAKTRRRRRHDRSGAFRTGP